MEQVAYKALTAKQTKAFTLLEVMISVIILGIMAVAAGSFVVNTKERSQRAEIELQAALIADNQMTQLSIMEWDDISSGTHTVTVGSETYTVEIETLLRTKPLGGVGGPDVDVGYLIVTVTPGSYPNIDVKLQTYLTL